MNESSHIERIKKGENIYVSVDDIVNLCEVSRDRHNIMGHVRAAETMDSFALALQTILLIE